MTVLDTKSASLKQAYKLKQVFFGRSLELSTLSPPLLLHGCRGETEDGEPEDDERKMRKKMSLPSHRGKIHLLEN